MKLGAGALFVAVGLLLLWAAVTGRLGNVENAWGALKGEPGGTTKPTSGGNDAGAGMSQAMRAATERLTLSSAINVPVTFPITPTFPFERSMHSNMGRVVS